MYVYEGHTGDLYVSDCEFDYEDLYCWQCGDSDWLIGYATTKAEAWDLLLDMTNIDDSGGYNLDYVKKFIDANWDE